MTQTAVEWLVEELGAYLPLSIKEVKLMFEQAKEMEKQQIKDAYEDGYSDSDNTFELNKEYYNLKFKNQLQG